jgi:plasmid stabilization system protein ParE
MAGRVTRTARAEQDLIEIWTYIAADNPRAADRLLDRIDEARKVLSSARSSARGCCSQFPISRRRQLPDFLP